MLVLWENQILRRKKNFSLTKKNKKLSIVIVGFFSLEKRRLKIATVLVGFFPIFSKKKCRQKTVVYQQFKHT